MSIWLRSQDKKKLVEAKDISVVEYWKGNPDKYECVISVYGDDGEKVAAYPTEARALEVMDEIENHIVGIVNDTPEIQPGIQERWKKAQSGRNVFQLPRE